MKLQKGFVMLQVLLVFSILVVIIAQFQYKQRVQIKRVSHSLFLSQAQIYIDSSLALAKVGLTLDSQDNKTDHLYEVWNKPLAYPIDETTGIEAELSDLQGRFNLNWLSAESNNRTSALKAFKRLLALLEAEEAIATELSNWFDKDSGIDYDYNDEEPAYAPAFRPMADVSELLLLKSVDRDQYEVLAPFVSALPADSALNINTAPKEVIMSIASFITEDFAEQTITDRYDKGISSVADFRNKDIFEKNDSDGVYLSNLTVSTSWFDLFLAVTIDENRLVQRNVIYRDSTGNVTIALTDRSVKESNIIPGDPFKTNDDEEDDSSDEATENE